MDSQENVSVGQKITDPMEIRTWIEQFYEQRRWSHYGPFERLSFLMEEAGETARAVRAYEIGRDRPDEAAKSPGELKADLQEEMGDVLVNLLILSKMYGFSLEELLSEHRKKLIARFGETDS